MYVPHTSQACVCERERGRGAGRRYLQADHASHRGKGVAGEIWAEPHKCYGVGTFLWLKDWGQQLEDLAKFMPRGVLVGWSGARAKNTMIFLCPARALVSVGFVWWEVGL